MDLPDNSYLEELDDLIRIILGAPDLDVSDVAAVEAASDRFEQRMTDADQATRDSIGQALAPVAISAERVASGYQQVVDTAGATDESDL